MGFFKKYFFYKKDNYLKKYNIIYYLLKYKDIYNIIKE